MYNVRNHTPDHITKLSYESRFHCELLSVLCEIELFADCVQGSCHFRQGTRSRILALMADPWMPENKDECKKMANLTIGMLQLDSASATSAWLTWMTSSITLFGLANLIVHWISIFVSYNYWQHPWILFKDKHQIIKISTFRFQPASQSSELGQAAPPKMLGHCRKTPKALQTLPPWSPVRPKLRLQEIDVTCTQGKHVHISSQQRHQRPTVAIETRGACLPPSLASTPGQAIIRRRWEDRTI